MDLMNTLSITHAEMFSEHLPDVQRSESTLMARAGQPWVGRDILQHHDPTGSSMSGVDETPAAGAQLATPPLHVEQLATEREVLQPAGAAGPAIAPGPAIALGPASAAVEVPPQCYRSSYGPQQISAPELFTKFELKWFEKKIFDGPWDAVLSAICLLAASAAGHAILSSLLHASRRRQAGSSIEAGEVVVPTGALRRVAAYEQMLQLNTLRVKEENGQRRLQQPQWRRAYMLATPVLLFWMIIEGGLLFSQTTRKKTLKLTEAVEHVVVEDPSNRNLQQIAASSYTADVFTKNCQQVAWSAGKVDVAVNSFFSLERCAQPASFSYGTDDVAGSLQSNMMVTVLPAEANETASTFESAQNGGAWQDGAGDARQDVCVRSGSMVGHQYKWRQQCYSFQTFFSPPYQTDHVWTIDSVVEPMLLQKFVEDVFREGKYRCKDIRSSLDCRSDYYARAALVVQANCSFLTDDDGTADINRKLFERQAVNAMADHVDLRQVTGSDRGHGFYFTTTLISSSTESIGALAPELSPVHGAAAVGTVNLTRCNLCVSALIGAVGLIVYQLMSWRMRFDAIEVLIKEAAKHERGGAAQVFSTRNDTIVVASMHELA